MSTEVARRRLHLLGFRSRWVESSQGRLHILDAEGEGHGPPIVLLHGLSANAVHFLPILGPLRDRCRRVVAIDMPGHGRSPRPATGLTSEAIWSGLQGALDAFDEPYFVLLGSSMGGFAAVRYADARPERLAGLVLCSPGGAPLRGADLSTFKGRFALRRHADGLGFVDAFLAKRPAAVVRHALAWGVRQTMADPGVRALLASVGHRDFLAAQMLAGLRPPTYLIWGQRERLLPESSFVFFARHLPSSAWIERPVDYGHTPYLEDPQGFVGRVGTFIEERTSAIPGRDRPSATQRSGRLRKRPFRFA